MKYKQKWQINLFYVCLILAALALVAIPWNMLFNATTDITLLEGDELFLEGSFPFNIKVKDSREDIIQINNAAFSEGSIFRGQMSLKALKLGKVTLEFHLLGLIPIKEITVNVLPEMKVIPGGHSIGIKLKAEGVLVVGHNLINHQGNFISPAKEAGIKIGDYIVEVNDVPVNNLNQVSKLLKKLSKDGKKIKLKVRRDEQLVEIEVEPLLCSDSHTFQIGLYIRDSAAGVGTMTFFDPETKIYGALGHVIADIDTNKPIDIEEGEIVKADIIGIKEARKGYPGEKNGVFVDEHDIMGNINKNTDFGIFGKLENIEKNPFYDQPIPIALANEIKVGPAEILTVVEGEKIEAFEVEIQKINAQGSPSTKSMVIKITDGRLIAKTGGIVQGMSGSPIIQEGKLVGAVTHVFVNEPLKGYGVFVEWMLLESGIYEAEKASFLFKKRNKKKIKRFKGIINHMSNNSSKSDALIQKEGLTC